MNKTDIHPPDLMSAWMEWGEKCAILPCSSETQSYLGSFAVARLRKYLNKYRADNLSRIYAKADELTAWSQLEIHLVANTTLKGKSYKSWLFERGLNGGGKVQVLEGSASKCMETVARQLVTAEGDSLRDSTGKVRVPVDSFENTVSGEGEEAVQRLEDLIPCECLDPAAAAAAAQLRASARKEAPPIIHDIRLTPLEMTVVAAQALGLAPTNPEVAAVCDRGKSAINSAVKRVGTKLEARASAFCAVEGDSDPVTARLLAKQMVPCLAEICLAWARQPENGVDSLFHMVESKPDDGGNHD